MQSLFSETGACNSDIAILSMLTNFLTFSPGVAWPSENPVGEAKGCED